MITVNPRVDTLDKELIEAYRKVVPATLGHILESGMESAIHAVWRPVHLVGPALTVQAYPQIDTAVARALEIAKPGDVLVLNRGGDLRHANWGEFAAAGAMAVGIAGMVTDGVVTDAAALERVKCPTFARGVTAMTIKRSGIEEGAVNVPVHVGGVVVNPGDMILADDDGVMVASPQEARDLLATCQKMEEREVWMREQLAAGKAYPDIRKELASS
ncbi:MAG: RraA family protein [Dehalococcoidia bacterium]|nr:RraA family protein [Chloroflexota bacterium]